MLLKKCNSEERTVDRIVREISVLWVPPEDKYDVEMYRMVHCIATTFSREVSQTTLGMPAETDILKNGSLFLLHLAKELVTPHAKQEGF